MIPFFPIVSCETKTWGLDALLRVFGDRKAKALVAVVDSPMCEVTVKLARLWDMPLFTWTCPLVRINAISSYVPIVTIVTIVSEKFTRERAAVDRETDAVFAYDSESPGGNVD